MPSKNVAEQIRELLGVLDENINRFEGVSNHLMRLGPAALPAVPALVGLLRHRKRWVRQVAAETLGQVLPGVSGGDPHRAAAVAGLLKRLDDRWDFVRLHAAIALGRLGHGGDGRVVPLLVEGLDDRAEIYQEASADALAGIGVRDAAAAAALIEACAHTEEVVQEAASRAIRQAGSDAVLALLTAVVRSRRAAVAGAAGMLLRAIGEDAWDTLTATAAGGPPDLAERAAAILRGLPRPAPRPAGPGLTGIARMANASRLLRPLVTFYLIGEHYLPKARGLFAIREAAARLDASPHTVAERLTEVTDFFRSYFSEYGHPPDCGPFTPARDADPRASEADKVVERAERKRPRVCEPVGRWAWELTHDFLASITALPAPWPDELTQPNESGNGAGSD